MAEVLGSDRAAVLCRELTKMHEEVLRATLGELAWEVAARGRVRGEAVLVVAGATDAPASPRSGTEALLAAFARALAREEGDPRRALRVLSRETGRPRGDLAAELDRLGALPRGS